MADDAHIAAAMNRIADVFEKRPAAALDTTRSTARLSEGLRCTVTDGGHSLSVDMPDAIGGEGSAPSPGVYGRAALVGCIAIGVKMTAARRGIAIQCIDVDLEMDWDDRGLFGMNGAPAATTGMRVVVTVTSDGPRRELDAAIAEGLANDPWLHTFINPQTIEPVVRIREKLEA